jgi:tetratricopeptide (TPR) repeat protein
MTSRIVSPLLAVLLLASPTPAFARQTAQTVPPASAAAPRTEFDELRVAGFDALYNLDYPEARKRFDRMVAIAPDRPSGYLYVSNCMWLEMLNKTRRLQTNLYSDDSFFADTKEEVDKEFDAAYRAMIDKAIKAAEKKLKANPKDVDAMYYKGAAHGALAAYEATVTRAFLSALRNSNKSVDLHEEVLKLDPKFADANLSIGLYNYVVGSLPGFVKVLVAIGGVHGSKKKGLELVKKVATDGHYASDDARVLLIALYKREKRYADALAEVEYFVKKYPDNYVVRMELADVYLRTGKADDGLKVFEGLVADERAANYRDIIEYQYGDALLAQNRPDDAAKHFTAVIENKTSTRDMVSLAHLRLGQAHDLGGRRDAALAEYKTVLARPNVYDSHDQAKNGTKKPFAKEKS